jgi:GNAT superfamily N-acetyltransferase
MSITIRKAGDADFPALIAIIAEFAAFQRSSGKMINTPELMSAERDAFTCFVAVTEENEIIGYAICFFAYFTWSGRSLYLDDLFVKEAFRGQKIGKRLLDAVVAFAVEERCKKVRWQVSDWNTPAQEFYKKFGAVIDDVELNCDLAL